MILREHQLSNIKEFGFFQSERDRVKSDCLIAKHAMSSKYRLSSVKKFNNGNQDWGS